MKCPVDDTDLSISSREGIEIDFCPQCRGVWLDRGELDKIIERAAASYAPVDARPMERERERAPRDDSDYRDRRYDDRDRGDGVDHGRRRKKRSFLDDLFDFD